MAIGNCSDLVLEVDAVDTCLVYSVLPFGVKISARSYIYVKQLDHRVKVFTEWDEEKYMLGKEGDFLAVRKDDHYDIYIIEKSIFEKTYEKV